MALVMSGERSSGVAVRHSTVTLPYPPSANKLWRFVPGSPTPLKSEAYRKWLKAAVSQCWGAKRIPGAYRLTILATRPDNMRRDLGNLEKAISDLLQLAGIIEDDCLAQSILIEWMICPPVKGGAITATVEAV